MDFTYCEFPSTVSIDTFKAYFNLTDVKLPKVGDKSVDTIQIPSEDQEDQTNQAKSLRHLVLDSIVENWSGEHLTINLTRNRKNWQFKIHFKIPITLKFVA